MVPLRARVMTLEWAEGIPAGDDRQHRGRGARPARPRRTGAHTVSQPRPARRLLPRRHAPGQSEESPPTARSSSTISGSWAGSTNTPGGSTRRSSSASIRKDYRRVAEVHFEAGYRSRRQGYRRVRPCPAGRGENRSSAWTPTRISMARLLTYLFEVTERFGMENAHRADPACSAPWWLVEGVARTLHPQINIWEVARPVVESYIRQSIGPRGAERAIGAPARVLRALRTALAGAGGSRTHRAGQREPTRPASRGRDCGALDGRRRRDPGAGRPLPEA